MLREVHLQSRISLVMCLKPQARCVKSCRQCYTLQRAFQLPCLLLPCTEPMKIYGNPVSEVLQALTSEGFSATLGVPQRPVSCEDHVAQWNMDIRFRKWTNRDVKSSIFVLDSSISAKARTTTSSPPPRGLLSSAKEPNVPVFLCCCCFFFIFMALFKRKNLTSELSIVQVRLHVCVNV